jgi:hypothetical protein
LVVTCEFRACCYLELHVVVLPAPCRPTINIVLNFLVEGVNALTCGSINAISELMIACLTIRFRTAFVIESLSWIFCLISFLNVCMILTFTSEDSRATDISFSISSISSLLIRVVDEDKLAKADFNFVPNSAVISSS